MSSDLSEYPNELCHVCGKSPGEELYYCPDCSHNYCKGHIDGHDCWADVENEMKAKEAKNKK